MRFINSLKELVFNLSDVLVSSKDIRNDTQKNNINEIQAEALKWSFQNVSKSS